MAYNNLGYANLKLKNWDAAKKDLETAVKLAPDLSLPYVNLAGYYWLHKKDKKNALNNLDQALKRSYKDIDGLYEDGKKGWMFKNLNNTPQFRSLIYK